MMRAMLLAAMVCVAWPAGAAEQTRCGWLGNPTPANWWLDDADGSWTISAQGGWHAEGFFDLPMPDPALDDEWVSSNGEPGRSYYGHGCACLVGRFDGSDGRVLSVASMRELPLARCRADAALPPEPTYE